jgi:hypothetical protein
VGLLFQYAGLVQHSKLNHVPDLLAHTYNQETEAVGSRVQGQPGLHSKTWSQNSNTEAETGRIRVQDQLRQKDES